MGRARRGADPDLAPGLPPGGGAGARGCGRGGGYRSGIRSHPVQPRVAGDPPGEPGAGAAPGRRRGRHRPGGGVRRARGGRSARDPGTGSTPAGRRRGDSRRGRAPGRRLSRPAGGGLHPGIAGLGLDAAGVEQAGDGVAVDSRQRTSVPHIYAAGDATGGLMLSSVAAAEGTVVGRLVLGLPAEAVDPSRAAQAVYTEPEIAWVGLQEEAAAAAGRRVRVSRAPFSANQRALMEARPRGFAKLIADPADDTILGGLVVGRHAAELIGIVALAVRAGLPRRMLADTLLAYPSLAETLAAAAR
ncbi:MAG: FAD-dependent oxidoreductase [Actinomycetota bacterium]